MIDEEIVRLYFDRDEQAIHETKSKYHNYCTSIAYRVLGSFEDTEECVSDAYLKTWNTIPPAQPKRLQHYLGRITRNLALDRFRMQQAQKRCPMSEVLAEWEIPTLEEPSDVLACKELSQTISKFVHSLSPLKQRIFLLRYWYFESPKQISQETGTRLHTVNTYLYRTRKQLMEYLKQEGFDL